MATTDIPPLLVPPPPPPPRSSSSNPEILYRIQTPYSASAFTKFLAIFPHLEEQYFLLPHKLQHGFPMGEFPDSPPAESIILSNSRSADTYAKFVEEYFAEEVEAGRLSGPFSQEEAEGILGGPFQCSPITVDVQPQDNGEEPKLRLCCDFSRRTGPHPAPNDYSDIRDFPTRFDGVLQVAEIIANAPQAAEAMTLDISKFHRRTPVCPAHKRWYVTQAKPGEFYIQHCCPFGARPSESNSGEIANAALDIWRALAVGPICKWADDMVVFRFPRFIDKHRYLYDYDREEALTWIEELGIPWHPDKGQDFAPTFTYIGFQWDLSSKAVSLPDAKREKFLERLHTFLLKGSVTREDAMLIQGTLTHIVYVYPDGRSRLPSLSRFISSFGSESLRLADEEKQVLPDLLLADLGWWLDTLRKCGVTRSILPRGPAQNLGISVDASTDWGIGIVWKNSWDAWRLIPGWRSPGRDIGWLEGVAVELVSRVLELQGIRNTHVLVHSDNQGIIGAFNKGSSKNVQVNLSIQRAGARLLARNNSFELEYVRSEDNPADALSRGALPMDTSDGLMRRLPPIDLPSELTPYLMRAY